MSIGLQFHFFELLVVQKITFGFTGPDVPASLPPGKGPTPAGSDGLGRQASVQHFDT